MEVLIVFVSVLVLLFVKLLIFCPNLVKLLQMLAIRTHLSLLLLSLFNF